MGSILGPVEIALIAVGFGAVVLIALAITLRRRRSTHAGSDGWSGALMHADGDGSDGGCDGGGGDGGGD